MLRSTQRITIVTGVLALLLTTMLVMTVSLSFADELAITDDQLMATAKQNAFTSLKMTRDLSRFTEKHAMFGGVYFANWKTGKNYPVRYSKHHYPDGALEKVIVLVNPTEAFVFSPDGELIRHRQKKACKGQSCSHLHCYFE